MSFLEIALSCIARGWFVVPTKKGDKWPPLIKGGKEWANASNDEAQVRGWWTQWPEANVAIAGRKSDLTVVDNDHGLTCYEDFIAWRDRNGLPVTYTVRSGRRFKPETGEPEYGVHMYYSGSLNDCEWVLDGCSGQIKSGGGYVMAAGCIHPDSGERYEVLVDAPLAPTPDIIRQLRKPVVEVVNNSKVRQTAWSLPVHESENRTGFLLEQTGAMRNLGCGVDAIRARMIELNEDPEIIADPLPYDRLEHTAENCAKFAVPEAEPIPVLGTPKEQPEPAKLPERVRPEYPITAWEGTIIAEFAKLCAHDNNIPPKMYAEAFRCALGAVVGDRISCPGVEGALPRSFTVIVAPKGKGKGTAIRRAVRFFTQTWGSALLSLDARLALRRARFCLEAERHRRVDCSGF